MRQAFLIAAVLTLAATITGCGEREQSALYEDGKYRGKPDSRSWDNAPPPAGAEQWKQGDHASWENQVRARSAAQNENRRIGH